MTLDLLNPTDRKQARRELIWGDHGFLRAWFNNHRHIGEGMYRANQPSPKRIEKLAAMGIKTIVNLRGVSPKGYYELEKEACAQHGITLVDHRMYSRDVHTPENIHAIKHIFETIEYPAVMHCKSGADRTGIAGVLYKHFKLGAPISEAVEQLSLKYLHVRQGKTGMLDFFFQDYLTYVKDNDISFIDWVDTVYDPPDTKARFMSSWGWNVFTDKILRRE